MNTHIVLTVIGNDRPGIVKDLSATLAAHGGNWTQSSMSTLAGQFAGILLASVPDAQVDACLAALQALESKGLKVLTHASKGAASTGGAREFVLEVVGNDHEGIVRDITGVLSEHGVSIEDLESRVESASMAGGALFRADATLRVPDGTDIGKLQDDIEDIATELMVDIRLKD